MLKEQSIEPGKAAWKGYRETGETDTEIHWGELALVF